MKNTKRILWILLVLIGQIYYSKAQERFQSYTYLPLGTSGDPFIFNNAVPADDGNYFACGYTQHSGINQPYITKIGHDGSAVSSQTFGAYGGVFTNMTKDIAGNLVACGNVILSGGAQKFGILQENQSGTVAHYNYYDATSNLSNSSNANSIIETISSTGSSTGYLAVGTITIGSNSQLMIVKVNGLLQSTSVGTNYWQQIIPINGCQGVSVIQKTATDYVLLASMNGGLYVREFNETGVKTGEYYYVDASYPGNYLTGASIQNVSGGGFIIAGNEFLAAPLLSSSLLLNLSSSFTKNWATGFHDGCSTCGTEAGGQVIQDVAGNFVFPVIESGYTTIVKASSSTGALIGSTPFGYTSSSFNNTQGVSLFQAPDNDYVCAGTSSNSSGNSCFYLMKGGSVTNCNGINITQGSIAPTITSSPSSIPSYTIVTASGDAGITGSSSPGISQNGASCSSCTSPTIIATSGCLASGSASLSANSVPGLHYQWYSSSGLISGATSNNYTATATGTYYVKVSWLSNMSACPVTSNTVTVNAVPAISTGPSSATICSGTNASFSVAATGTAITYQWQVNSGSWANVSNTGVYSGATTSALTLTSVPTTMTTYQYRCVVSGTCTPAATSTAATLTVNQTPIANAGPNSTICQGSTSNIGPSSPDPSVSYSWQPSSSPYILHAENFQPNPDIEPTSTTVYTVTESESGCTTTSLVTITVIQTYPTAFGYSEDCSRGYGGLYNFSVTTPTTGATYTWTLYSGATPSSGAATTITKDYWPLGWTALSNSYTINLKVSKAGCDWSSNQTITAGKNTPVSYSIPSPPNPSYNCSNQTASVTIPIGTGSGQLDATSDFTYSWLNWTTGSGSPHNVGSTTVTASSVVSNFTGDPNIVQTFQLTINSNQCSPITSTINVKPFLVLNAPLTWNIPTVSGVPTMDILADEAATTTAAVAGTIDITGWTTFLSCSAAPLAITPATGITVNSSCGVGITPGAYTLGSTHTLTYTWTDAGTGCTKTSSCNAVSIDPATITVTAPTSASTVCLGTAVGTTANVSWTTAGWTNLTNVQLYINWYSYSPTPGSLVSGSSPQSSSLPTYCTSGFSFNSSVAPGTSGTNTFYAAICINRPGMPDVIYKVSSPVTIYANPTPVLTLNGPGGGVSTNISSPTHLCSTTYPDIYTYTTIGATATGGTSPYLYTWTDASGGVTQTSSTTSTYNTFTPSSTYFSGTNPGTYTCTLSDANGCANNKTAYYWNDDVPAVITGVPYACSSSVTALTGNTSYGVSSQWKNYSLGTVVGSSSTYSAPPGTWQYFATSGTCVHPSAPFTVTTPPTLTLSAGTYNVSGTPITLNMTSGASVCYSSTATVYSITGSVATISSSGSWTTTVSPGYYWVTYTLCGTPETTNMIKVGPPCSSYTSPSYNTSYHNVVPGFYNVTSNISLLSGINYYLGNIDIKSGATLTISTNVVMDECSEIDIESGGSLILNSGANIQGCTQWRGIDVKGGGTLTINAGFISDAITAVYSEGGGSIQVSGCTFVNNVNHITVSPYSSNLGASIKNCTFENLIVSSTCTPFYGSYKSTNQRMIYLEGIKGINIGDGTSVPSPNVFTASVGTNGFIGIETFGLIGTTGGSSAINIAPNNSNLGSDYGNTFDGPFQTCISSTGVSGVGSGLSTGLNIVENQFGKTGAGPHPVNGIYFTNTDASYIGDGNVSDANDMENMTNGIDFVGENAVATGTYIEGNRIENNSYGIVIAPDIYPITTSATAGGTALNTGINTIQLSMSCNSIGGNSIGIVGTGNIIDQGNGTYGAGNQFSSTYTPVNLLADLFWECSGTGITYHANSSVTKTAPGTSLASGSIFMNNGFATSTSSGYHIATATNTASTACSFSSLSPDPKNNGENLIGQNGVSGSGTINSAASFPVENSISVFPNPTVNLFNVKITQEQTETWSMEVYDILGQRMLKNFVQTNNLNTIDGSAWAAGVYDIKLVNSEGKLFEKRIVIQR